MKNIKDPGQKQLFDPFERLFSPLAVKTILNGWQGLFRTVILELLPAEIIAGKFNPGTGRPTKELYSMAGLILISEYLDWTVEQASAAYMYHTDIWYALNLEPGKQSMSTRTIERYQKIFRENELASGIMSDVTSCLVELSEIDISKQRLDSTHVFSNMATFGRTRLMVKTIKSFLTRVKRHNRDVYDSLPEELRDRYTKSKNHLFADTSRRSDDRRRLCQQVAEDMYFLIEYFIDDEGFSNRSSFKVLQRVFKQQCEVIDDKVDVRKKTGGDVIQNPSDPDATYDGHKGPGYQVQLSETCSSDNDVQLITDAIPQTACENDSDAVEMIHEDLKSSGNVPDEMLADTSYGSDDNVQSCQDEKEEQDKMDLISPVAGREPESDITVDDFEIDEETHTVKSCPAGHKPLKCEYDSENETTQIVMSLSVCSSCELRTECPIERKRSDCRFKFSDKDLRLAIRRRIEKTDAFRDKYRMRSGIEGTNSGIKRRTGLGRLRVRGRPAVFNAILLKTVGWNILQAARCEKIREYVRKHSTLGSGETVSSAIKGSLSDIRGQIRPIPEYFHRLIRKVQCIRKYQLRIAVL